MMDSKLFVLLAALATVAGTPETAEARRKPGIRFTKLPPIGSSADLEGRVLNASPRNHRVAVYIFVGGWWTKPYFNQPTTAIGPGGFWKTDITTGGNDPSATRVAAFLIPKGYSPPRLRGAATFPDALKNPAKASILRLRRRG